MASVTFSSSVGGDGSTVTDDSNATTGLASGGHRVRFVPALAQTVAVAANTVAKAVEASASAAAAAQSAIDAESAAGQPLIVAFPVGAIYITAANTNPASWLGGTWSQIAAGRALIGVGTLGADTYAAGDTGGAARHTLTTGEMPSHSHGGATAAADASHSHTGTTASAGSHTHTLPQGSDQTNASSSETFDNGVATPIGSLTTSADGAHTHAFTTDVSLANHSHSISAEGGGAAHENRMPYLAVYFWQRTA